MRTLSWAAAGVIVACAALNVVFAGCGSEETPPDVNPDAEAGDLFDGGTTDAPGDAFIGTIFIGMVIPIFTLQDYIK